MGNLVEELTNFKVFLEVEFGLDGDICGQRRYKAKEGYKALLMKLFQIQGIYFE